MIIYEEKWTNWSKVDQMVKNGLKCDPKWTKVNQIGKKSYGTV